MIKPSPKLLLAGAVFVVAAAVLLAYAIVAGLDKRDQPGPRPALQATVGKTMLNVAPMQFCTNVRAAQCDAAQYPAKLPVEAGQAIVISLPDYITERPWFLTVQRYDAKRGEAKLDTITHVDPASATLVLKSTEELWVAAVEINVPSQYQDAQGNLIAQAVWGIDTTPKDFALVQKP
ncbi:DUF2771 family protein [Tsukamurella paurometabola]|uniref:Protein of uncharacterized function (DUF2771) n=1 Tax=Tsukamurella paurometabola TaxID=2061 RepID=A0A3P8MB83_TSUPA|nr:DUF2771 family protein [Tsukamurella paurometabola]UEA85035.1 DUF2771 domain-containing protein [Tsukamurella paurometabola]VDR37636.1 Protein of uncharacterised function (DUF2771) [Tsukamurella paurometabola]